MVYEVPSSIDPGNYMIQEQNDEKIVLSNQAKIILHRLKKECEILVTKELRLIPNPLRYDDDTENLTKRVLSSNLLRFSEIIDPMWYTFMV